MGDSQFTPRGDNDDDGIVMVMMMKVIIFRMTKNGKFCDNGDIKHCFH